MTPVLDPQKMSRLAFICQPPAAHSARRRECAEHCSDPAHCVPEGTHFHDLRHFYALALIAANLNPKVIQARMGHATMAETMDTYGHLFPDSEDLGRGAVDDALGTAAPEQDRNRRAG
jgi:integrase